MLALEVIFMLVKMSGFIFPVEEYLIHMIVILAACLVLCVHSIWNDVYWGLNNNHKRYYIIIAVAVILNIIPVAAAFANGRVTTQGFDSLPILNLMVLIWMAIIGVAALIKKCLDLGHHEED
jgi:hypothetical protein